MTMATIEKKIANLERQVRHLTGLVVRTTDQSIPYDDELSVSMQKKLKKLKMEQPVFEYTGSGSLIKFLKAKK
jgi:hypothetical protein